MRGNTFSVFLYLYNTAQGPIGMRIGQTMTRSRGAPPLPFPAVSCCPLFAPSCLFSLPPRPLLSPSPLFSARTNLTTEGPRTAWARLHTETAQREKGRTVQRRVTRRRMERSATAFLGSAYRTTESDVTAERCRTQFPLFTGRLHAPRPTLCSCLHRLTIIHLCDVHRNTESYFEFRHFSPAALTFHSMAQERPSDSLAASAVTIRAHHTIQCADAASIAALDSPVMRVGPLDHLVPPVVPIAVVFVFRSQQGSAVELIPIARLQRTLARLLDYYPHLTGRVEINAKEHTPGIVRLGTGAMMLEATCSDTLRADASLTMSDLHEGGNALMAPFTPTAEALSRDPMFTVQHTRFPCGSVTLGVRVLHMLCDADGFFQLMHDMAALYRAMSASEQSDGPAPVKLAIPPHIQSHLAATDSLTPEEKQAALRYAPALYELAPTTTEEAAAAAAAAALNSSEAASTSAVAASSGATFSSPPPPVVGRFLSFSSAELVTLKAFASDPSSGGWISTFDTLSAHLYHRVYVARARYTRDSSKTDAASPPALSTTTPQTKAQAELSTDFLTPVNWRGADRLNLPARYFPNALFTVFFRLPPEMLADTAPLSAIARSLHDSVRGLMSQQQGVDTLRWLAAQPDKSRVRQGFRYANGFMLSQWSCFDLYGIRFDADENGALISPALVQPPFTPISLMDGLGYILPTKPQHTRSSDNGGSASVTNAPSKGVSLDVALALSAPLWEILDCDPLFRPFKAQ